jgi:hypothetical protein
MALRPHQAPYEKQKAAIMANPSISFWLKAAVEALENRDPLDAASDAGFLFALAEARANEACGAAA